MIEFGVEELIKLTEEVSLLLSQLRSVIESDFNEALRLCEHIVIHDGLLPLLSLVQCVEREIESDFAPKDTNPLHLLNASDTALMLLVEMYQVSMLHLENAGWISIGAGSVFGSSLFRNQETAETSENPVIQGDSSELTLLQWIAVLVSPTKTEPESEILWPLCVQFWNRRCNGTLLCDFKVDKVYSVIDVMKRDDAASNNADQLREFIIGPWKGFFHDSRAEQVLNSQTGISLESWQLTTMTGLCVPLLTSNPNATVLSIGLNGGILQSFLINKFPNLNLDIVEPDAEFVQIAQEYFGYSMDQSISDQPRLHVQDPLHFCQSHSVKYNAVFVDEFGFDSHKKFSGEKYRKSLLKSVIELIESEQESVVVISTENGESAIEIERICREIIDNHSDERKQQKQVTIVADMSSFSRSTDDELKTNECAFVIYIHSKSSSVLSPELWASQVGSELSFAPNVQIAQRTSPVHMKQFLSHAEIELIHHAARQARHQGACVEVRSESVGSNGVEPWFVIYFQTNNLFHNLLPGLKKKIVETVKTVDTENWKLFRALNPDEIQIRVAEYHTMSQHGRLPDPLHYDLDSLLTIDMMLTKPGVDYEGGEFQTLESDGRLIQRTFEYGDAIIFVSHKPHCVNEVRQGTRHVLVVEFWRGSERWCGHRCEAYGKKMCLIDRECKLGDNSSRENERKEENGSESDMNQSRVSIPFRLGSVIQSDLKEDIHIMQVLWEPTEPVMIDQKRIVQDSEAKQESGPLRDLNDAWDLFN